MRKFRSRRSVGNRKYRDYDSLGPRLFFAFACVILASGWIGYLFGNATSLLPALLTATVAAASIVFSLARAQESNRDQYTLSLVAKRFDDGDYAKNVRIASDLRRSGVVTENTGLAELGDIIWNDGHKNGESIRASYAIIPLLNYWEHVCTAYVDNRIKRTIFEDLVNDLIRDLVQRYPAIIGQMRAEDPANMEHLCAVWFAIAPRDERKAVCPLLGNVPGRLCSDDQWRWLEYAKLAS